MGKVLPRAPGVRTVFCLPFLLRERAIWGDPPERVHQRRVRCPSRGNKGETTSQPLEPENHVEGSLPCTRVPVWCPPSAPSRQNQRYRDVRAAHCGHPDHSQALRHIGPEYPQGKDKRRHFYAGRPHIKRGDGFTKPRMDSSSLCRAQAGLPILPPPEDGRRSLTLPTGMSRGSEFVGP